jgi:Xaa-Pro aminopeptidase
MGFNLESFIAQCQPIDLSVHIPRQEFEDRVERIRAEMKKRQVDVAIAFGNELRPGDTGWITNYDPQIEPTAVVIGPQNVFVLGGPEGKLYAEQSMQVGEFRCLQELKIPEEDYPGFDFFTLNEIFNEASSFPPKSVGLLTCLDIITQAFYELIINTPVQKVDMTDFLLKARYFKSKNELKCMRAASQIATYAMQAMIQSIKPGKRELEIAAVGEFVMKHFGADRIGVSTIVASGERASSVLGRASNRIIKEGEMILFSISPRYEGMASCVGRSVIVGEPNADQKEIFQHVHHAYQLSIERIQYNAPARDADLVARNYLKQYDLEPLYSQIHNIGWTEAMEGYGAATQYSEFLFPKGIALQLDIGIFAKPFKSLKAETVGIRLEDPLCITHEGITENMTTLLPDVQELVKF